MTTPIRIALAYLALAVTWIALSDQLLHWLVTDPKTLLTAQTAKGWFFVSLSALLVYWLSRRLQRAMQRELDVKKRHIQLIRRKAYTDYLTGLPNRRMGLRLLRRLVRESRNDKSEFFLLFVGLDNFKQVNDNLSHDIGDQVIQAAAVRLQRLIARGDYLVRQGGDEFLIISQRAGEQAASVLASRVVEAFNEPLLLPEQVPSEVRVSCSVGGARFPQDGAVAEALLRGVDLALHDSKHYKNCYRFYQSSMDEALRYRYDLEQKLRLAVANDELQVYYQPIYNNRKESFTGVEALLRWRCDGRDISPEEFIPLAENSGHIRAIGAMVLQRACRDICTLSRELGRELTVSVNVSPKQFAGGSILGDVLTTLHGCAMDPHHLILEITEGVFLNNIVDAGETLEKLMALGVSLSMDDFGKGYSSLNYLRMHPFSYLKIDQMFIQGMEQSRQDAALVQASVAMAKGLNLKVVAEGVETDRQRDILASLDVDYLQGYLLARPMSFEEFRNFLLHS